MRLLNLFWNKKNPLYIISLLLIMGAVLFSCTAPIKQKINIAAASNLNYLFPVLKEEFEKQYPGVILDITFGSSGKLTSQIMQGAPFHVFLSANISYPDILCKEGFTVDTPKVYACGELILFKMEGGLYGHNILQELSDPEYIVAIPNPELSPYGVAAFQFLDSYNITISGERLLLSDNISIAAHYSLTGADLGFIPISVLYAEEFKEYSNTTSFIALPANSYGPIKQAMVIIEYGNLQKEINYFVDFIFSDSGQSIFLIYGYEKGDFDAEY